MEEGLLLQRWDAGGAVDLLLGVPGRIQLGDQPPMSMRWYILDAGNRVLIVDIEDNPKGLSRDELFRSGDEIVESFVFSSS